MRILKYSISIITFLFLFLIQTNELKSQPKLRAIPEILCDQDYYGFSETLFAFDFVISPYIMSKNKVSAILLDKKNKPIAEFSCIPLMPSDFDENRAMIDGEIQHFKAYLNTVVVAGTYIIEIKHKIGKKEDTQRAMLTVFTLGLTDGSKKKIEQNLESWAYYGNVIGTDTSMLNPVPMSFNKIPLDGFKMYLWSDAEKKRYKVDGLFPEKPLDFKINSDVTKFNYLVTYFVKPTQAEFDVYSTSVKIKQDVPYTNLSFAKAKYEGSKDYFKVRFGDVVFYEPDYGNFSKKIWKVKPVNINPYKDWPECVKKLSPEQYLIVRDGIMEDKPISDIAEDLDDDDIPLTLPELNCSYNYFIDSLSAEYNLGQDVISDFIDKSKLRKINTKTFNSSKTIEIIVDSVQVMIKGYEQASMTEIEQVSEISRVFSFDIMGSTDRPTVVGACMLHISFRAINPLNKMASQWVKKVIPIHINYKETKKED